MRLDGCGHSVRGGGDIAIGGPLPCLISLSVLILLRIFKCDAAIVNRSTNKNLYSNRKIFEINEL